MPIIDMQDVVKKYGRFKALSGLSMAVNSGEVFGFIGPNGAGKTTAIRVLLGALRADEGRALVFGKDAWSDAVDIHKRIAYVPGDVSLWANFSGGEVIDILSSIRGGTDAKKRARLIERFELDPSKKCRAYSKGNRQKVALIAAFASDADLFILDEPTSGLDPLMEQVFQECIEEQTALGKTVLLSSHILSEVERLCGRVAIIRKGVIVESGTLAELRHLTRMRMSVQTRRPISGLETMDGVHELNVSGNEATFFADSTNMEKIISHIAAFGAERIESAPPSLEDLFMQHYGEDKQDAR